MGVRAFVIGGYVRDCFLGRPSKDIDIVVEGSGIELAEAVGAKVRSNVSVFRNFGTAMLRYRGIEVEFVGARKESYRRDSRKPIVEDGTLEDDQLRRDFTINAMAFSLQKEDFGALVDPFGGIRDLAAGIIRTPLDPDTTYSDDPLRMVRAVRFATKLSTPELTFTIVPESLDSIRRNRNRMEILSKERIVEELNKILVTPKPSIGFRLLDETGLLDYILPQLAKLKGVESVDGKGHKENFTHTLEVLDNVARVTADWPDEPDEEKAETFSHKLWLRWAALLHDIGKPRSKRWEQGIGWTFHNHNYLGEKMIPGLFRRMKLPMDERMKYVQRLVGLHMRPIAIADDEVTDSAVRRLLFEAGEDIDDLMLLCEADITSRNQQRKQRFLDNFRMVREKLSDLQARDSYRTWTNPITGEEIMQTFGIEPCKIIGELKQMVKDAIWDSQIPNTHEAAREYMLKCAAQKGLFPVNPDNKTE